MISHTHKCIFIHIPKCAGSSVEMAFGLRPNAGEWVKPNFETLIGWSAEHQLHLQHATPQQLIDHQLISTETWNSYYKFISIRNPFARAYSDYNYLVNKEGIRDHFSHYLNATGKFETIMKDNSTFSYRGDHLYKMCDYFTLYGKEINYDTVVRMQEIDKGFHTVCRDLNLPTNFFKQRVNTNSNAFSHYSKFYNEKRRVLVEQRFERDLTKFNYVFEDKKTSLDRLIAQLPAYFLVSK